MVRTPVKADVCIAGENLSSAANVLRAGLRVIGLQRVQKHCRLFS